MTTVLLAAMLLSSLVQAAPPTEKVRLFLGPAPATDGFVNMNTAFKSSYQDMEKAYRDAEKVLRHWHRDAADHFPEVLTLVTNYDEADLILEVTYRNRPNFASNNQLRATLFVVGSEFKVDMDGRTGLGNFRWATQAKGLLRQAAAWVEANRAALDKIRASRAPKEARP